MLLGRLPAGILPSCADHFHRGRDELDNLMTNKRIGAYVGVDPTAPSMHVGHLLPMMALFWMYLHGFSCVTLVRTSLVDLGLGIDNG
jgi:hypothetical protein